MSYYEKYGVLLAPSKSWEPMNYGFKPEGMGDCISRTMDEARKNKDTRHIMTCWKLLRKRKRWPDELQEINKDRIANNMCEVWWSKIIQTPDKPCFYRPQTTEQYDQRSVLLLLRCLCCVRFISLMESIKPPWWLFSPPLWLWRRYIIIGKGKRLYLLVDRINTMFKPPDYVIKMINIRNELINFVPLHNGDKL